MFIVNSDRDHVVNMNRIETIRIEGNYIVAISTNDKIYLGKYSPENRTNEVFKEMLRSLFVTTMYMQNCNMDDDIIKSFKENKMNVFITKDSSEKVSVTQLECAIYYMPEE